MQTPIQWNRSLAQLSLSHVLLLWAAYLLLWPLLTGRRNRLKARLLRAIIHL